ncbi:pentapeptide repeat-containing protein [Amycolatopsis sp. NBRC 101858]|uniref:pentapeptide repeat-containing protein n=1 Tax=Amycolatopsis sp. NBRC 101858 TaxID=3032200 RepID=UPI002555CD8A|nr:pentapeptide repeat-containing protein [Amycolatopsis sp. NBRC 101858]
MKWMPKVPNLPALDWALARGTLVLSGAALLAGITVLFGWIDWLALGWWARAHAVPLALFAAAGAGMAAASWRMRGQHAPRTRASGMSWWAVVGAAIVVVIVAWVATNWLLGEATAAKDPGAARVDAIKTGLGIGAGTTGIFALLLAVRRQWHSESDATEKNVTELYAKAADQLGSAEAPVRLAGLYALERLAHDNPGQRQSIVNVICAYLRMPHAPSSLEPANDSMADQERVQEREVRLAGQRILTDHLAPRNRRKFWDDIDLDFTNAHLIDFTLRDCRPRNCRFDGATFAREAAFDNATFTGDASFDRATFTRGASFDIATFTR